MRKFLLLMFVSMLMMVAGPAWSDTVRHVLQCQQEDGTSDSKVEAIASEWLEAAKKIKGAEDLELNLNFPVAANAGEVDFLTVMIAPSFAAWGAFLDNYPGSEAEKVDNKYQDNIDCSNGSLWESVKVE